MVRHVATAHQPFYASISGLRLIEFSAKRFLIVKEMKLSAYLGKVDKPMVSICRLNHEFWNCVQN